MKTVTRSADANWKGNLDTGYGLINLQSRVLMEQRYSFSQRVDEAGSETNPEELIAAATASCFGMALSKTLQDDDTVAQEMRIRADLTLRIDDDGPSISDLKITASAILPDYSKAQFDQAVATTAENCPVLKLLRPGLDSVSLESELQA